MGRSVNMLIAGMGAATFIFSELILNLIFNSIMNPVLVIAQEYCPPYWWNYLGGNMVTWLIPFIFSLMLAAAIMIIVRVFAEIGNDVTYHDEDNW